MKKKYKYVLSIQLIAMALLLGGCFNTADMEIKKIQANTSFALPLAQGSLTIQDLLNKVDVVNVKVYPDGLVYFQYVKTIESTEIRKLFTFGNQNMSSPLPVPAGPYPGSATEVKLAAISSTLDFNFNPEKLSEIQFKNTSLSVSAFLSPANPNFSFDIEVKLASMTLNGVPFQKRISGNASFSLDNYIALLNSNKFTADVSIIIKPHANTVTLAPGTTLNIGLGFNGINFKYIKGFLGDRSTTLAGQTFNVDAFGSALDKIKVSFANPQFSIEIANDYGIPLKLNFTTLEARKKSVILPMITNPASPITVTAPSATPWPTAITPIALTNAKQVANFIPDQIYYAATANINQGLTTGVNYCADTSKLRVRIKSEVPLYGSASGIILADTFNIDMGQVNSSDVQVASMKTKITNEMPLDATVQIYLADSKALILDSIFTTAQRAIVVGSKVTATGDLQSAGVYDNDIPLTVDKINKLFTAKKLILKSVMNTVKDASGSVIDVKFKSSYKMSLNIGLKVQLKINSTL
jgi:hypothetical protein